MAKLMSVAEGLNIVVCSWCPFKYELPIDVEVTLTLIQSILTEGEPKSCQEAILALNGSPRQLIPTLDGREYAITITSEDGRGFDELLAACLGKSTLTAVAMVCYTEEGIESDSVAVALTVVIRKGNPPTIRCRGTSGKGPFVHITRQMYVHHVVIKDVGIDKNKCPVSPPVTNIFDIVQQDEREKKEKVIQQTLIQ